MADYPEEFPEFMRQLNLLLGRYNSTLDKEQQQQKTSAQQIMQVYENSMTTAISGLKLLHGSVQDAAYAVQNFVRGWGVAGTAIIALMHNVTASVQAFNKLTDVGQTFGGSILQMQELAGEAGLTLEQFTAQVSKSSVVIAQLSANQVAGVRAFSTYQEGVRTGLKSFGMFGMTMTQVNDASAEYAETLRLQGQWERMTTLQRQQAAIDFITQVNQMAAATGKSREEIMKQVNQIARQPMTAAMTSLYSETQRKAIESFTLGFSKYPGEAGQELGKMFGEMVANQGRDWQTDFGNAAQSLGLEDIFNAPMRRMRAKALSGQKMDAGDEDELLQMATRIRPFIRNLSDIAASGGELAPMANKLLAVTNQLEGFRKEIIEQRAADAKGDWSSAFTKLAMNWENQFNQLTGKFREGFYKALLNIMPGTTSAEKLESFNKAMEKASQFMFEFGEKAGRLIVLFSKAIPTIEWIVEKLITVGTFIGNFINNFIANTLKKLGVSDDWAKGLAALGTILTGFIIYKKLMSGFKKTMMIEARTAIIYAKSLLGGGGGGGVRGGGDGGGWGGRDRRDQAADRRRIQPLTPAERREQLRRDRVIERDRRLERRREDRRQGTERGRRPDRLGRAVAPKTPRPSMRGGMLGRMFGFAEQEAAGGVGGLVRGGVGGLTRGLITGGIGGLIVGAVMEGVGQQVIEAMPVGDEAKQQMTSALNYAATGAGLGMIFGPEGAVIGGLIGAIAGLAIENWPSVEEFANQFKKKLENKYKSMVAPTEARAISENESKLAIVTKNLQQALVEKEWAKEAPESSDQIRKSVNDRIIRLLDESNQLNAANLQETKKMNDTIDRSSRAQLESLN